MCEQVMTVIKERKKIVYQDDEYTIGIHDSNNWVLMDTEKLNNNGWTANAIYGYYGNFESLLKNFIRITAHKSVPKVPLKSIDSLTTWYNKTILKSIKKYFPKIEV